MPVMDEFREEREQMKTKPFKERFDYFWYYYKWYVLGGTAVFILLCMFIHDMVTAKDVAFYAVVINSVGMERADEFDEGFVEVLGLDTDEFTIKMDDVYMDLSTMDSTTTANMQKLVVYIAAGDIDVCIAEDDMFSYYANSSGMMFDLNEFLTAEEIEKYQEYFYYIDMAAVEEVEALTYAGEDTDDYTFPDPTKPELMEEPKAVGIYLDAVADAFDQCYYITRDDDAHLILGIYASSSRDEETHEFIAYLFSITAIEETAE